METKTFYSRPVIPLLLSMISGIVAGAWLPGHGTWMVIVVLICAVALLFFIGKKRTTKLFPIVLLSVQGKITVVCYMGSEIYNTMDELVENGLKFLDDFEFIDAGEYLLCDPNREAHPYNVKQRVDRLKARYVNGYVYVWLSPRLICPISHKESRLFPTRPADSWLYRWVISI